MSALEASYATTTDPVARRRIQSAIVKTYRGHVSSLVRRTVELRDLDRAEAEWSARAGLLTALANFDASKGVPFWPFAVPYFQAELRIFAASCEPTIEELIFMAERLWRLREFIAREVAQ